MANDGGGGGAPAGGSAGGAPASGGAPAAATAPSAPAERGRIGDFSSWSGQNETQPIHPSQTLELQDPSLVGRGEDEPFQGWDQDAQAQALAVDDSMQAEVMTEAEAAKWREEYEAWRKSDDLPEPFLQKFGTVTIDGQRYRIPVAEAFQGYQRQADYSAKLRQVYQMRDHYNAQFQGLQRFMGDLDEGQRFIDAMIALKKFKGFHEAAIIYGKQLSAEQAMNPEQRALVGHTRALRAELQRVSMVNQQLAQQVQQMQQQVQAPSRDEQMLSQQLALLFPKAAESVRWVDSPAARREFEGHFADRLPSLEGKEISTEFLVGVMQAAMQSIQQHLRAGQEQPLLAPTNPAPPARRAAPPTRGLPGPAPSQQQNGQQKRARISDMNAILGRR